MFSNIVGNYIPKPDIVNFNLCESLHPQCNSECCEETLFTIFEKSLQCLIAIGDKPKPLELVFLLIVFPSQ